MSFPDKLRKLRDVSGTNYWAGRIYAELCYMSCLSSVRDHRWDERLEAAADLLIASLERNSALTKEDGETFESSLADLSPEAKSLRVYCVSHAHIDMNWQWGFHETASVTVDTFRTILNLMREYPDFTFAQSQASTYKIIEDFAPEMLPEIRKYVSEGRWEVSASTWTETDKNMPNGESLSRHILYTKRYLGDLLGIDPDSIRIDFEPDTFGHNLNVPEICRNGGIDYYYHMRANDDEPVLYRWRSKSGKELLVFHDVKSYNGSIDARTFEDLPLFCAKTGSDTYIKVYGVGDHGGGPTRNDVEHIMDDAAFPLYPTVEFGTYAKFFAAAERIRERLPLIDHELNFVFTGCYTTQTRIKMANRIAEDRAYEAEAYAAAATALAGAPSRTGIFRAAWRRILFNHFHDILPGSGITETREYALGNFQDAMAGIDISANASLAALADAMDTSSVPFEDDNLTRSEGAGVGFAVEHASGYLFPQTERGRGRVRLIHLFNPTCYDRDEAAEVTVWDYPYDLSLAYITDASGSPAESEVLTSGTGYWGHSYVKFLIQARVPAFGWNSYILSIREAGALPASTASDDWCDYIADEPFVLENGRLRAVFDPMSFALTSLIDKENGEELVSPGRPAGVFRYIRENPIHGMTAWRVGPYMSVETLNTPEHEIRLLESGCTGMRRFLKYEIRFASSSLTVTAELRGESRILNFHADVDWHEIGIPGKVTPQLGFHMPVSYACQEYTYDIPMGEITRKDLAHDVPGNSWIRMERSSGSGPSDRIVFVITDTKYGFRGHDGAGAVTLIRSSTDPDPYPERGIHHFNIGVGICDRGGQYRAAAEYVHPLSFRAGTKHGGSLPLEGAFLRMEAGENVTVSGVKNGEDGGLVLRVSDRTGKGGRVKLVLSDHAGKPSRAALTDITERHVLEECSLEDREASFTLEPYSMATVRIE